MRCDAAQLELSARLDGDADPALDERLDAHLARCPRCLAFDTGLHRLREAARLEPAPAVPVGLLTRITDAVGAEMPRRRPRTSRAADPRVWRSHAVAFAAGAAAAVVVLGGMPSVWSPGPLPAAAAEVPARVAGAGAEVDAYRVRLDVTERGLHADVPVRRFEVRIAFRAPEHFEAIIDDRTSYPSRAWRPQDGKLVVDADRWYASGRPACPVAALPACAAGREVRAVQGRPPFDGDTPMPTDVIVPMRTLAGNDRVELVGRDRVLGRDAVVVAVRAADAEPLFAFLRPTGTWRPFFGGDRVLVSLDTRTWIPLAYSVHAAGGSERQRWASAAELSPEADGEVLFEARATDFALQDVRVGGVPKAPARDGGFRDSDAAGDAIEPGELRGLRPYRSGMFTAGGHPSDEVVLSYSRGLSWVVIRQTRTWAAPTLFGDVGSLAARVDLPGGGVAYAEPATTTRGRRVAMHADEIDLYLESNLPLSDLIPIAASLPVEAKPVPEAWDERTWSGGILRRRVTLDGAVAAVPALRVPSRVPHDYAIDAVHLVGTPDGTGVTVYYRRRGVEPDGIGIRYHQSSDAVLPPPTDPGVASISVGAVRGRYSPAAGRLEWIEDRVYRSIEGAAFTMADLVDMAESVGRS